MKKTLLLLLTLICSVGMWAVEKTATLTGSSIVKSGTPSTSYADYAEGVKDNQNYEWTGRWCYQKTGSAYYQMVQIKAPESSVTSRLNIPTYQGIIKSIEVITTNTSATASNGTKASGTLYITKAWAKADYSKEANVVASGALSDGTITFDLSGGTYSGDGLYIVSSAAIRIWSVKVIYEETAKVNVTGVSFNQSTLSLLKGDKVTLTATITPSNATNKKVIWSSDNESVATVANGVVTAVSVGTANITAKSEDNQTISATCAITVTVPAKTGNVYEKVTSNMTDWTGKYLIVYEPTVGTGYAFNASLATLDDLNNYKEISTSNTIEGDVLIDQYVFEVAQNGDGYSIKSQTDLYIGLGGYNNGLSTNAKQTQYVNNFSYNTTKECAEVMLDFGSDGKCYLQFNDASNQMRFRYYKGGSQKNIQLYKLCPAFREQSLTLVAQGADEMYYATFSSENPTFWPNEVEVDKVSVEGTAMTIKALDTETAEINSTGVTGYFVPANTGILVQSIENNATYYVVENKTVAALEGNMLYPASKDKSELADHKFYKLAYASSAKDGLGFYWGAAEGAAFTSREGSAYLAVPTGPAAKSGFKFNDDEATGINNVKAEAATGVAYNLAGQRVNATVKGIVIMNGKKFINK